MNDPRRQLDLAAAALGMALEALRQAQASLQAGPGTSAAPEAALTVEEAAKALRLRPPTIRAMCVEGRLVGAYKPAGGKSWLIPSAALAAVAGPPSPASSITDLAAHRLAAAALKGAK